MKKELEELDVFLNNKLKEKANQIVRMEDQLKSMKIENEKQNLAIQRL